MNQEEASNLGILNNSYFSLESAHGNPAYDEVSFDGLSSNHSVPLNIKSETSDEPLTLRKDEQWYESNLVTFSQCDSELETAINPNMVLLPKSKENNCSGSLFVNCEQDEVNQGQNKPNCSYSCLVAMALLNSEKGYLDVNGIYDFLRENFQYFKTTHPQWKNVVRHALSFCRWFKKIQYQGNKRLNYWTIDPLLTHRIKSKVSKVLKKKSVAEKWLTHPEKFDDIKRGSLLRKYEPFSAPLVNLVETYPTIMQKVKLPQHLQKA
ncbi:forkhead box protein N4-like isoform X1 [Artemia franciscana]|uniref:Fork-head domain-containing protein n=1 Tax=Artemia franciscana TaxID=6661 RepID=A0AA88LAM9_ARTSF|nr:hypothetical protein QYM36_001082 [Artemia franciscana]KAK2724453.1 hypothetical protein QYM36_001082 [Artemia franciscana]